MRRHFLVVVPDDQAITLKLPQRARKHPLGDAFQPSGDFSMSKRSCDPESMNNPKRPAIAGVRQHFPFQAILFGAECIAHSS